MKIRSRFMALIMALALMVPISAMALVADDYYGADGVLADVGIMPMASVSGYTVELFSSLVQGGSSHTMVTDATMPTSGNVRVYGAKTGQGAGVNAVGYRILIPANSSAGVMSVADLIPCLASSTSTFTQGAWGNYAYANVKTYILFPDVHYSLIPLSGELSLFQDEGITRFQSVTTWFFDIPAHAQPLYLYVFCLSNATSVGGGCYGVSPKIVFTPNTDSSSTLSSILTALNAINTNTSNTATRLNTVNTNLNNLKTSVDGTNTRIDTTNTRLNTLNTTNTNGFNNVNTSVKQVDTSVNNFMKDQQNKASRKFEDGYFENLGKQIDKAEEALTPANSALPNGGDVGGFVDDIGGGLGLSGSAFDGAQFEAATGAFTGAQSSASGGPWEFFTQAVADDLSGDTPSGIELDDDFIMVWFVQSEGRYGLWSNQSSKDTK